MKDISIINNKKILPVLQDFTNEVKNIIGDRLEVIILYGSYARNEETNESDIDLIILINDAEDNLKNYREKLSKVRLKISLEYDVVVSLILKSYDYYIQYNDILPFYSVIRNEGIELYGR